MVKNERRQSLDNAPYGPSYLALIDGLFPGSHPYNGAVIGSMADLSAANLEDVRGFFRDFYTPSNATLAIRRRLRFQRQPRLRSRSTLARCRTAQRRARRR